jgi:uncharacterized protein YbaR (Trm112 family)
MFTAWVITRSSAPWFNFLAGGVLAQCIASALLECRTIPLMIAKDLLEILVCPACKQALEYRENPESLKCKQCHRVYAVKDDIPIMLVDEATIETTP